MKNGEKINLTPKDLNDFVTDPKNAAMIQQVPTLGGRLAAIAQRADESVEQTQARQFAKGFEDAVAKNNPKIIVQLKGPQNTTLSPPKKIFGFNFVNNISKSIFKFCRHHYS